jgi:hypothetical protein
MTNTKGTLHLQTRSRPSNGLPILPPLKAYQKFKGGKWKLVPAGTVFAVMHKALMHIMMPRGTKPVDTPTRNLRRCTVYENHTTSTLRVNDSRPQGPTEAQLIKSKRNSLALPVHHPAT